MLTKWKIFCELGYEFCGLPQNNMWGVTDEGKFFLNNGEEIFLYDSLDDALLDWMETLTENDNQDWATAIEYIKTNCMLSTRR